MAIDAIALHTTDNVATAVQDLKVGQEAAVRLNHDICHIILQEDIPYGHKFTLKPIQLGEKIFKYGQIIGRATTDIGVGYHAHIQNIESLRGRGDLKTKEDES
ncbi:UxaA family hydrolase [Pelosinus fermentans]|uniref:SAF domain protein n=1 Tax=Pelosinus fermentans JBW45 TaxID=1192197 RepID=I8TME8_9FIRM|nr:UxaA family hydrolase [Pelosinus fermentans]AJQ25536.1 SAF domain protein [Pelosinus fermentans JBW45]